MPTRFMRPALLCAMMIALTGCIFSNNPVFDLSKGATDIPVGRFQGTSPDGAKFTIEMARHGNLYLYGGERDTAILSFHAIGGGFYVVTVIPPGRPIYYGVLDARSQDKLPFAFLACTHMPDDLVPSPEIKGHERCNATDPERLTAIANLYKADMTANRVEASKLHEFRRIP